MRSYKVLHHCIGFGRDNMLHLAGVGIGDGLGHAVEREEGADCTVPFIHAAGIILANLRKVNVHSVRNHIALGYQNFDCLLYGGLRNSHRARHIDAVYRVLLAGKKEYSFKIVFAGLVVFHVALRNKFFYREITIIYILYYIIIFKKSQCNIFLKQATKTRFKLKIK